MIKIIKNSICVVHGHKYDPTIKGDQPIGTPIKCFSIKILGAKEAMKRAKALHKAIELSRKKS